MTFEEELIKAEEIDFEKEIGVERIRKAIVYCIVKKIDFEFNFCDFEKFLLATRNLDTGEVSFYLKEKHELVWVTNLEKY